MASKFAYTRRLAAALGYIGLNCQDRVVLYGLSDELRPLLDPARGRARIIPFLEALEETETFGHDTDFQRCTRTLEARHSRRGVVIVLSDFLFPNGFEEGLKRLRGRRHDIFCLQVHDPADLTCDWKGDLRLECVETGRADNVTVTPREAAAYVEAIRQWNEDLRKTCARRGIGLATTTSDIPFETVIQQILRKGGLVK